jgi:hypothetical protein
MVNTGCDEDVAIFCQKIARQLRFVASGLENLETDDDGSIIGGGADILETLAVQCLDFSDSFSTSEKKCMSCEAQAACLKLTGSS